MQVYDQIPVSTLEEIKVNLIDYSEAKHNTETGEIKWNFSIEPNNSKALNLKYSVKYPKNNQLIVE